MTVLEPSVSVVIPCHDHRQWSDLVGAVHSALAQSLVPAEIVVTVDHNPTLFARAQRELDGVTVLENRYSRGASGNRNTGAFHTRTPLIALLDGDSRAHPGWLARLVAPLRDPAVVGTGGAISPVWQCQRPAWFPGEFLWAIGGSYTGMPTTVSPTRNVWSASMAVRRDVFEAVDGFRDGFGKIGDRARPEDTDLCVRMARASGGHWMYVPDAVIDHPVPPERTTFGFFLARCFSEGRGKVEMARLLGAKAARAAGNAGAAQTSGGRVGSDKNNGNGNGNGNGGTAIAPAAGTRTGVGNRESLGAPPSLGAERDYLRRTVPRAVTRGFAAALRGDGAHHAARAGAALAGVLAAGVGGVVESMTLHRSARPATLAAAVPARLPDRRRPDRAHRQAVQPKAVQPEAVQREAAQSKVVQPERNERRMGRME
jgi:GT2 family glycosyltransferase